MGSSDHGSEWLVEAHGCDPDALRSRGTLENMFTRICADLGLHPLGRARWHQFPGPAGITGVHLLAESHLACHTFPEYGSLCLNLFCCRPRDDWDFAAYLKREFGAVSVSVRRFERPYKAKE